MTWSGSRRWRRLVATTLANKGTVCHLCGMGGATSADHDPPRQELVRRGVPDPDDLRFLNPAHLVCNHRRGTQPLTPELRAHLRALRLADLGLGPTPTGLSPRFTKRRPVFGEEPDPGARALAPSLPRSAQKNASRAGSAPILTRGGRR